MLVFGSAIFPRVVDRVLRAQVKMYIPGLRAFINIPVVCNGVLLIVQVNGVQQYTFLFLRNALDVELKVWVHVYTVSKRYCILL